MLLSKNPKSKPAESLAEVLRLNASHQINDHRLVSIADAILSVQPTSVNSERVFSLAGWFHSKLRSRMSPETLDDLILLKENFNLIKYK